MNTTEIIVYRNPLEAQLYQNADIDYFFITVIIGLLFASTLLTIMHLDKKVFKKSFTEKYFNTTMLVSLVLAIFEFVLLKHIFLYVI